jgi:hypothetical protein
LREKAEMGLDMPLTCLTRPAVTFGVNKPLWFETLNIVSPSERFGEKEKLVRKKEPIIEFVE